MRQEGSGWLLMPKFQAFVISALLIVASGAQVSHVSHVGHGISHGHHAVHAPLVHAVHAAPLHHVVHAAPAYHAPVVHAAPAYHAPAVVVKELPEPYTYTYGVADDYSKANFNAAETSDANGVVSGSYSVALPDGRIQHVKYTADHVHGYQGLYLYLRNCICVFVFLHLCLQPRCRTLERLSTPPPQLVDTPVRPTLKPSLCFVNIYLCIENTQKPSNSTAFFVSVAPINNS